MSRRWLRRLALFAAAVAGAFAIRSLIRFPWGVTWTTLLTTDRVALGAAVGLNLLSLVAKAWGWQRLLLPGAPVRWRTAQEAVFAGAAVGSVSVGVTGEAARLRVLHSRDGVTPSAAMRSLVVSRIVEAAALGGLLAAASVVAAAPDLRPFAMASVGVVAAATATLRWTPWLRSQARLALPVTLGVANWLCQWGAYHWAIAAAHVQVTPARSLLALLLANVGGIFRLTPGNLGVVPGAVVLALRSAHVPLARALAAGVALQAVQVLPVLAIGIGLMGYHGMRTPAPDR